jgi:hypothetical protein
VSPAVGSTGGDTAITITGTGLAADALVTLGGVAMTIYHSPGCGFGCQGATTLIGKSRARGAGTVDLVVTNPDRQTAVLAGGYASAAPDSFDFNGTWDGGAMTWHVPFGLTIKGDMLIRASCDDSGTVTLSPPVPVIQGAFWSRTIIATSGSPAVSRSRAPDMHTRMLSSAVILTLALTSGVVLFGPGSAARADQAPRGQGGGRGGGRGFSLPPLLMETDAFPATRSSSTTWMLRSRATRPTSCTGWYGTSRHLGTGFLKVASHRDRSRATT